MRLSTPLTTFPGAGRRPRFTRSRTAVLALAVGLLAAAPCAARTLPWRGTLELLPLAEDLPRVRALGTGLATVNANLAALESPALHTLRLDGDPLRFTSFVPFTDPEVTGVHPGISVVAGLGAGTLGPFWPPAALGQRQLASGALPVPGHVRLCLILPGPGCPYGPTLWNVVGGEGLGLGGSFTQQAGDLRVSVSAAPWTVRTTPVVLRDADGTVGAFSTAGFVHGAASLTGFTAAPGGAARMVTFLDVFDGESNARSYVGAVTVVFLPEPGRLALLGSGAAGLWLLGRGLRLRRIGSE